MVQKKLFYGGKGFTFPMLNSTFVVSMLVISTRAREQHTSKQYKIIMYFDIFDTLYHEQKVQKLYVLSST